MQFRILTTGLVLVAASTYSIAADRLWKSVDGRFEFKGEFVTVKDGSLVVLRKSDGSEIEVSLEKLSLADREFVGFQKQEQLYIAQLPVKAATTLEREAQSCRAARDALLLYTDYLLELVSKPS